MAKKDEITLKTLDRKLSAREIRNELDEIKLEIKALQKKVKSLEAQKA
ncbi:MAG: hypothetical protein CEN91_580 [Candidatus Berkelbacteria bacterium Licking1014_85]|uniref:Uncharacterized protein n=1 Tax=Candidatus Berkelbacteria bacterium Licking1014_85 TaxID=2017148 RepID=A0A554LG86_9BACT|nr:MAG: hypothetical protein CEN91_580 [Candidatus Berkelbacteria bacterium Licking1014_85]